MAKNHKKNVWNTVTYSIDEFCAYFGAVSLKTGSTAPFEPIKDYTIASSSSIKEVSADLLHLRCSRTYLTVNLYIGDISFTNI